MEKIDAVSKDEAYRAIQAAVLNKQFDLNLLSTDSADIVIEKSSISKLYPAKLEQL